DEAAEAAADQTADDESGAAGTLLLDDFVDRLDGPGARGRWTLHDLVRGLRAASREERDAGEGGNRGRAGEKVLHRSHDGASVHSGIAFSRYIAASSPLGRPSGPSHLAKMGSISPER